MPDTPVNHSAESAPRDVTGLRLMAVHAHPDDESSKGAATMVSYRRRGAEVLVVSCTGGERGDILNPALAHDTSVLENIHAVRQAEMAEAARILDVQHQWLGYVDSGFPEGDPLPPLPEGCFALAPVEESAEALARQIRAFRPHVVFTYDENGGYPHPDHVMTHVVSMAAIEAAADASAYPDAGEPWQVLKVYYLAVLNRQRIVALHEGMLAEGLESPYAEWTQSMDTQPFPERTITTRITAGEFFPVRDDALRAHATQIDPEGRWFAVPLELQQRVHPTEDMELALAYVPVDLPETDIFAGVPDLAAADELARELARQPEPELFHDGRQEPMDWSHFQEPKDDGIDAVDPVEAHEDDHHGHDHHGHDHHGQDLPVAEDRESAR